MLIKMNNLYYNASDATYNIQDKKYNSLDTSNTDISTLLSSSILKIEDLYQTKVIVGNITNITPTMTSNISPSPYVVSASSIYNDSYPAWQAFNKAEGSWITSSGATTGWLKIDFGETKLINTISIKPRSETLTASPKDFSLQGSNDGTNFTTLESFTNQINWIANTVRTYDLTQDYNYRYYRILVSSNNGYGYLSINELSFIYKTILERYKPIEKFDNFNLINQTDKIIKTKGIKTTRELIVASESYDVREDLIHYFTNFSLSSIGNVKIVFSLDNGVTWKTYINSNWSTLSFPPPLKNYSSLTISELTDWNNAKEEIALKGINWESLAAIPWGEITVDKIRFAYVITRNTFLETDEVYDLNMRYDAIGHLKKMKRSEYDTLKYNYGLHLKSLVGTPIVKINALLKERSIIDPSDNRPELAAPVLIFGKTNNVVTLTWNSILHADYYKVYVNGICVETTSRTDSTITIEKLEGTYFFTIRAYPNDTTVYKPSNYSNMETLDYVGYLANVDMTTVDGYGYVEVIVNGTAYKFKVKNSGV